MDSIQQIKIPIVVSTDNGYAIPTYVLLHSLINHKSQQDSYDIIVLTKDLSEKNISLLKSFENEKTKISVRIIFVEDCFSDTEIYLKHISVAAMYRLLLPKLLPEYDKCIYIDGDALICDNIRKAYDEPIDDYYIAAVKDIEAEEYINKFDYEIYPPTEQYVNSGFLLMNLKRMREDNLNERFYELSGKKMLFCDQDILNIACKDMIRILPLKYNAMVKYRFLHYRLKSYNQKISKHFTINEIYEAQEHPVMVHYAQPIKPWQCKYIYEGKRWNEYVKSNISNEIREQYINQYIMKSQESKEIQFKLGIRYVLSKLFLYKYLLKFAKKL